MTRSLSTFPGGLQLPSHKDASTREPIAPARLPRELILPLHQHIGEAAEPVVKEGDRVLKGQLIARCKGYVSAPVRAPSSGRITAIGDCSVPHPSGLHGHCVVIETDGLDQWVECHPIDDYTRLHLSALRNRVREAGIVGLGGAGFPSAVKLNPGPERQVDTLILNGAECEPYITCDDMLMRERAAEVVQGARIMQHITQARTCVIGVEDNKPQAIQALADAVAEIGLDIEVVAIPTRYPTGGEKQLIKVLTGKEIPWSKLPADAGLLCHNVGTAAAVYRAIVHGEPLVSRIVTVAGAAVRRPRNLEVLIGTPVKDLLEECEADTERIERLIMGGSMMGITLQSDEVPVIKTTNCVLAATHTELGYHQSTLPCIRCARCADACPVALLPQQLYWYARAKDFDKAEEYSLFDCIECGCCAYVCPSHIPLVQYYRYAKGEIAARDLERQKAGVARQRFDLRQERLEREKAERTVRLAQKKAQLGKGEADDAAAKQAAIQAAVERAQAKKRALASPAEAKTPESAAQAEQEAKAD
jgi:electron transport complex protein RnfC